MFGVCIFQTSTYIYTTPLYLIKQFVEFVLIPLTASHRDCCWAESLKMVNLSTIPKSQYPKLGAQILYIVLPPPPPPHPPLASSSSGKCRAHRKYMVDRWPVPKLLKIQQHFTQNQRIYDDGRRDRHAIACDSKCKRETIGIYRVIFVEPRTKNLIPRPQSTSQSWCFFNLIY